MIICLTGNISGIQSFCKMNCTSYRMRQVSGTPANKKKTKHGRMRLSWRVPFWVSSQSPLHDWGDVHWTLWTWKPGHPRRSPNVQKAHEKMINHMTFQGNASENHGELHFTPPQWRPSKRKDSDKCWWGCGGAGPLLPWWWEWSVAQSLWKRTWQFFKMLNIFSCTREKWKHMFTQKLIHKNW